MTRSARLSDILALCATGLAMLAGVGLLVTSIAMPPVAWTLLLLLLLGALAWIDARTETVPDTLTLSLVLCGLVYTTASGGPVAAHIVAAALLLGLGVFHDYATGDKGWIGSGDFFLVAGISAWFGPLLVIDVLALTSILLLLHGLVARRASVALAPSLASAATLIWLGGPLL